MTREKANANVGEGKSCWSYAAEFDWTSGNAIHCQGFAAIPNTKNCITGDGEKLPWHCQGTVLAC